MTKSLSLDPRRRSRPAGGTCDRDNLANLLVVEELAAANAAGFSEEEAMRVLVPGGKLCICANGKLDVTVKLWPEEM